MAVMSSLPLLWRSSAAIQAQGMTPAEGCPVQEQSSQSSASQTVPATRAALTAESRVPLPQTVMGPPSPQLASSAMRPTFPAMAVSLAARATPMVWSRIILARSTTSSGKSSYRSPAAY